MVFAGRFSSHADFEIVRRTEREARTGNGTSIRNNDPGLVSHLNYKDIGKRGMLRIRRDLMFHFAEMLE